MFLETAILKLSLSWAELSAKNLNDSQENAQRVFGIPLLLILNRVDRRKLQSMKAVIFDYDGVIADSFEANYLAWEKCFAEHNLGGFDRQCFRELFGTGVINVARLILQRNNLAESEDILWAIIHTKSEYVAQFSSHITLIPDLEDFLKKLSGLKLAIATLNSRSLVEGLNKRFGIDSNFEAIVGIEDALPNETDPKGFLVAAERLGVLPAECLVIEDSPMAAAGAKRCGMKCMALTTNRPRSAFTAADLIVDSYAEITREQLSILFKEQY